MTSNSIEAKIASVIMELLRNPENEDMLLRELDVLYWRLEKAGRSAKPDELLGLPIECEGG